MTDPIAIRAAGQEQGDGRPKVIEACPSIETYLARLRAELAGSDPALVQDALYDTEDHLRAGLAEASLDQVIAAFGTPREVADAWRESDAHVTRALHPAAPRKLKGGTLMERTFGVFKDPRTYSALVYMLLSLATGIFYFTWVVTGLSISIGTSILIFGVPIFLLFLASVRALALVEGRMVEALLGVRMPRLQAPEAPGTLWERLRGWLKDSRTWLTMLYMVLELPLGIAYFTVAFTALALVGSFFVAPFAQVLQYGAVRIGEWVLPSWALPLCWVVSVALLIGTLHLARLVGRAHAALARRMLVQA